VRDAVRRLVEADAPDVDVPAGEGKVRQRKAPDVSHRE
jgi:hypothetical protein